MLRRWRCVAAMTAAATVAAVWGAARAYNSWRADADLVAAKRAIAGHRTPEAHRLLADAAARRPGTAEVEFLLGASEQALGDMAKADAAWSRVPPGSPFAPHAAMLRARLVLRRDRLAEAEPLLLAAVKGTGPLAVEARDTLVNIYKIEGRFADARAVALEASGQYPDQAALLRELETLGSNNPISFDRARAALDRAARMRRTTTASGSAWRTSRPARAGSRRPEVGSRSA